MLALPRRTADAEQGAYTLGANEDSPLGRALEVNFAFNSPIVLADWRVELDADPFPRFEISAPDITDDPAFRCAASSG